jgi:hypothetical protein
MEPSLPSWPRIVFYIIGLLILFDGFLLLRPSWG